jgi:CheY-like chemotaxis protein
MLNMNLSELQEKLKQASQPSVRRFHALMTRRIKTILMVSSRYEAFSLEWDGSLTEDIYGTYSLLHLQNVPQLSTATSGREALEALRREKYDLVLVSSNLADMTIQEFGQVVKAEHPGMPVVMLIFAVGGVPGARHANAYQGVDYVFSWQGSAKVLLSIIKLVEDALNIDQDIQLVRIGVILVIEDSIKQYSFFMPYLYATLMKQAFSRVPYGVDENERQLRTRTRPKVVLARTFVEAGRLVTRYQPFLHGVISDLRVTTEERKDRQVGREFLARLKETNPGLPILLMSADESAPTVARSLGIEYVDKKSPRCVRGLEEFCVDGLGFGDFVFRDRQGREIRRARSLREFEDALRSVPEESIEFHSRRNQFSHWLLAQGETSLAELIRPLQFRDFTTPAEMRDFLCKAIETVRREKHRGIVADFRPDDFEPDYLFLMTGRGSLGGKARGLAFMSQLLTRQFPGNRVGGFEVQFPHTLVITTDAFDEFIAGNDLEVFAVECRDDALLRERFFQARLPESLCLKLRAYIERVRMPLAVRSSSHMEDSTSQPFAGLYETCMLPNIAESTEQRFEDLCQAVKLVYASAYTLAIKGYFQTLKLNMEEEKMAVIVQALVGRRYGNLFYPAISGVAQSFNYYPFARMEPEDGVASVALGFGKMVVEGGEVFRFCPKYPGILPQASTPQDLIQVTQKRFYALDLDRAELLDWNFSKGSNLGLYELDRAERDMTLHPVASVVSARDDRIVDDLAEEGARAVTFAPVLKYRLFPLCDILNDLLKAGKESMGTDVEIEFAANVDYHPNTKPEFYLLQIRPMVSSRERVGLKLEAVDREQALCSCRKIMGNGIVENIRDIVYCHPDRFDLGQSRKIAEAVGRLNQELLDQRRRYVLIGPGRWGTRVTTLGVPVSWQQVAGAALIVETATPGRPVDPSQGAHFFHNLASSGIGYFSILEEDAENFVRWDVLERFPSVNWKEWVTHVRLERPITVFMDALNHCGLIVPA